MVACRSGGGAARKRLKLIRIKGRSKWVAAHRPYHTHRSPHIHPTPTHTSRKAHTNHAHGCNIHMERHTAKPINKECGEEEGDRCDNEKCYGTCLRDGSPGAATSVPVSQECPQVCPTSWLRFTPLLVLHDSRLVSVERNYCTLIKSLATQCVT